ncbi:hypothetical protein FSP39_016624 [Pinctada imbricata]|uniref:D-isomer specific 2-hydroxyacid dehydrogenase NAD-binding domain-containing protein n=1 Tax=Pinctada imbricata TaxID=66713 RepID=A0AA88XW01_PINIB|nr:hypothetical protein FSP39_016624 [Pinctada imbricata]
MNVFLHRQKNGLSYLLQECDYLINVLPGTSETKDLLSGDALKSCKNKKPYFINIGRADVIDINSLEKAIREKWISGALLDVVESEPLSPDDPLWSIPNVTITPHCSAVPNNIDKVDIFKKYQFDDIYKVANSLNPFGMNINGMCRHPKESNNDFPFKKIWQKNGLSALLEECDYIVNVLPGTSETKDMLSGETLKSCKNKKPYFINIGRADIIDTESLEKAISEGWISGALLDVVEPEPLPPDHPLWSIPNVTITPHISGVPNNRNQMIDLFARNLEKFFNNEPLLYTFDCKSGY